ncbi:MAG: LysM peptidoglycan-binding domain-containing protein [Caldilineaceae bacterium]
MSNGNGYDHTNVEELLELALTRMAAGEGYADIIAAIPPENLDEFEGILQMVQDLEMLADVDVPRDPVAQAASRRSFVAEAEAMCAQHAATSASEDGDAPGFMARVQTVWTDVVNGLRGNSVRLAPIAMLLAVILGLGALYMVSQAEPGDPGYSMQMWFQNQRLKLASPDLREEILERQEAELAQKVIAVADRQDRTPVAVREHYIARVTEVLPNRIGVGDLLVTLFYQPDPNLEQFVPIVMSAAPQIGDWVRIEYQILPGQSGEGTPLVQGVSLEVLPEPVAEIPAHDAGETTTSDSGRDRDRDRNNDAPAASQPASALPQVYGGNCDGPGGWHCIVIERGDTLWAISQRTGFTVQELMQANKLTSDKIIAGDLLRPGAPVARPRSGTTINRRLPARRQVHLPRGATATSATQTDPSNDFDRTPENNSTVVRPPSAEPVRMPVRPRTTAVRLPSRIPPRPVGRHPARRHFRPKAAALMTVPRAPSVRKRRRPMAVKVRRPMRPAREPAMRPAPAQPVAVKRPAVPAVRPRQKAANRLRVTARPHQAVMPAQPQAKRPAHVMRQVQATPVVRPAVKPGPVTAVR